MTRTEFIAFLEESIRIEEFVIPIYARHIESTLFFAGFAQDKGEKVRGILRELGVDSERHRRALEDLLATVRQADKDVY